jgi:hypothetical protein
MFSVCFLASLLLYLRAFVHLSRQVLAAALFASPFSQGAWCCGVLVARRFIRGRSRAGRRHPVSLFVAAAACAALCDCFKRLTAARRSSYGSHRVFPLFISGCSSLPLASSLRLHPSARCSSNYLAPRDCSLRSFLRGDGQALPVLVGLALSALSSRSVHHCWGEHLRRALYTPLGGLSVCTQQTHLAEEDSPTDVDPSRPSYAACRPGAG